MQCHTSSYSVYFNILLRWLAISDRWCDLELLFEKFSPYLEEIFHETLKYFMPPSQRLIMSDISVSFLCERMVVYLQCDFHKTACMDNFVASIDEMVLSIALSGRPEILQCIAYSGHKRKHTLKLQAVTTPDWLCLHLHGPEFGRR